MAYAHALIELPNGTKYQRGDDVPVQVTDEFPDLIEGGAVRDEEYDPAADASPMPDTVEIEGVTYVKASDGAQEDTDARTA